VRVCQFRHGRAVRHPEPPEISAAGRDVNGDTRGQDADTVSVSIQALGGTPPFGRSAPMTRSRRFRTLKSIPGDLQTHALAGRIAAAGAGCVWVGPVYGDVNSPYHKANDRVQELSQFLSQSVAPCRYIDSTRFETGAQWPTTDGQHLTVAGYRQWGQNIAEAVGIKKQFAER